MGIFELTGCAGDALLILDCEQELLDIFKAADIQSFLMVRSDNKDEELDIAFIEGSVSTEQEVNEILSIRRKSNMIVAIGICSCFGGIQARFTEQNDWEKRFKAVYNNGDMTCTQPRQSKPIDAYIHVDYYLPGCPIGKEPFLNLFTRLTRGFLPERYPVPVCVTCKFNQNDCLLNKNLPCLGPLTSDGCGSICINHNLPCVGCFGPVEGANSNAEYHLLIEKGYDMELIKKKMANYSGTRIHRLLKEIK